MLGVSPQSVPKWERGETQPEISYIAPLADFFGVDFNTNSKKKHSSRQSRDNRTEWLLRLCRHVSNWNWHNTLLGYDDIARKKRIDEIKTKIDRLLLPDGSTAKAIIYLREALRDFPTEYPLQCTFAGFLIGAKVINSNSPTKEEKREGIAILERLLRECDNESLRLEARWLIALAYTGLGEPEKAAQYTKELPDAIRTKQYAAAMMSTGNDKLKACHELLLFTANQMVQFTFQTAAPTATRVAFKFAGETVPPDYPKEVYSLNENIEVMEKCIVFLKSIADLMDERSEQQGRNAIVRR